MKKKKGFRKIAIDLYIQDAINLKVICMKDKEKLIAASLSWSKYDELLVKTEELIPLHRKLLLFREDCKYEASCLRDFARECYKLRSKLRRTLNNYFVLAGWERKIPGMSRKKAYIDISQDLMELAVSAERFKAKAPGYFTDTEMITKARDNSTRLFRMSARKTILFDSKSDLQDQCLDKCRSLHSIMKAIRTAGKIAFDDNPLRRSAYLTK